MRRVLSLFMMLSVLILAGALLAGCGGKKEQFVPVDRFTSSEAEETEAAPEFDPDLTLFPIAVIADGSVGGVLDDAVNQEIFREVIRYAEENRVAYRYYEAPENSAESYAAQIKKACANGARVIIANGPVMQEAAAAEAPAYARVQFLVVDSSAAEAPENVSLYSFDRMENAFLAGAACVLEGYETFGILTSGGELPIETTYGFLQGIQYAAEHVTKKLCSVYERHYPEQTAREVLEERARDWVDEKKVDVILCCAMSLDVCANETAGSATVIICPDDEAMLTYGPAVGELRCDVRPAVKHFLETMRPDPAAPCAASGERLSFGVDEGTVSFARRIGWFGSYEEREEMLREALSASDTLVRSTQVPVSSLNLTRIDFLS